MASDGKMTEDPERHILPGSSFNETISDMNILTTEIKSISDISYRLLVSAGMPEKYASWIDQLSSMILVVIIAWLAGRILDRVVLRLLKRLANYTKNKWDDILFDNKVFHKFSGMIPLLIVYVLTPVSLREESLIVIIHKILSIMMTIITIRTIFAVTRAFTAIYDNKGDGKNKPVNLFFQIINVMSIFLGGIIILSILINQSVASLIAGLGASMAIIMLIFKDSILGFIAGWQLSANDLLRIGDWITVPKYGADGDVIEMNLYSVKVRNFDKTITTVPPYALISESFQNWRGMTDSGGRRIKRSVNIDMKSVKFADDAMLERLSHIEVLKEYLETKKEDIASYNSRIRDRYALNMRRQTNLGIFRAYITGYLKSCTSIKSDFTCMVRQLQPTEKGLPMEIYCFTDTTDWISYENIQSDIFDHILSVMPEFELEVFQYPSSLNVTETK